MAVAFVGLIHVLLIYAFVTGLAVRFVEKLPAVLQVEVVSQPPRIVEPVAAPPAPQLAAPNVPQIPVPQIVIAHHAPVSPHAITAIAVAHPSNAPQSAPSAPAEPAPAAIAPTAAHGVAGTHTIPPYPPVSLRLGEQGTVRLRIALDSSGHIRNVDVEKTSGSARLDEAAADWVAKHWRYTPATHNGKAVASSVLADVKFDLRFAR
ncbi:MAG: energy transducer TonB [Proteobacteria bacterium]|nr:energy transducer TonB [Pseudomonadota bacterium]